MNLKGEYYSNGASFYLNNKIYEISCIMKAAYNFVEDFYLFFDYVDETIIKVDFKSKENKTAEEIESLVGEFHNELLTQSIRYKVSKETKNIRELILGRALYNTCIEDEKEIINEVEENKNLSFDEIDLLDIGINWLDHKDNGDK